ncbi:MAG: site-specific integrase [bacterium]|nr:site-specific integrase [bacterium]
MNYLAKTEKNNPIAAANLLTVFADFLRLDIANGDARPDTVRTYRAHVKQWVDWCRQTSIDPAGATQQDVKAYRQYLVGLGLKHATIALKLTTIRRFYQAAVDRGLIIDNPAAAVRAPREREATDSIRHLSAGEAALLLRAIPSDGKIKHLRDRAIIALMMLEGLRVVEITRASVENIENRDGVRLLIHGKGRDGYIYPREDTTRAIVAYLEARGPVVSDEEGTPLFTATGNRAGGKRITRDGVRAVVDFYLEKADLKRFRLSCHALRHTCGALLYQATRDVRVVQETLRHSNIATAARYSHIIHQREARYTRAIPINL